MRLCVAMCCGVLAAGALLASTERGRALVQAARSDDAALAAALLERGADANAREADGSTALSWAVVRGNEALAERLLGAGADPDLANAYGVGPLSLAVENGASGIARLLLRHGADPGLPRESGETPLMTAARTSQVDVMSLLLEHGADASAREERFGQTALMWAAGTPGAVRLLLEHGADAHARSKEWDVKYTIYIPTTFTLGKTGIPWNNDGAYVSRMGGQSALMFAVHERDLDGVRALADAGIDVSDAAADGTTPLLAALYKWVPLSDDFVPGRGGPALAGSSQRFAADLATARFLLDRGAAVSVADTAGYTPLHGAVLAVIWATRSNKKVGGSGEYRRSPSLVSLNHASSGPAPFSEQEALQLVERLLKGGSDPNRQTAYPTPGPPGDVRINPAPPGSTALHIAASSSSVELVRLLAKWGADPNLVRKDGHSPFSVAVIAGNLPVIKELVAQGGNLEARLDPDDKLPDPYEAITLERQGQTVMHIAAANRAPEIVEYLHSQGAPIDWRNEQGETPLDLADHQERFQESLDRQGTDGDPERLKKVKRRTETTDKINELLAARATGDQPAR